MSRALSIAILLLATTYASAADRFARDSEQITVATTGRIIKIDARSKTLKVRGADVQSASSCIVSQNFRLMVASLRQRMGVTLPGGITIAFPGRGRNPNASKTPDEPKSTLDEYTVITTKDTVYQDGADSIRFEDFKNGETISIHGSLNGSTVTASRIAKWL